MKSFLLSLVFLITISASFAEGNNSGDVVYLKNGTVVQGKIIAQLPDISITVKANNGNILYYHMQEIEKLAKEEISQPIAAIPALPASPAAYRGGGFDFESTPGGAYVGIFEIGGMFGIAAKGTDPSSFSSTDRIKFPYSQNFFSLQTVQGRMLPSRKMYAGFGFGFDVSTTPELNALHNVISNQDFLIPLFMDLRGYILKRRISPYIEGKLGYAFCVATPPSNLSSSNYQYDGGGLIGISVGVRAHITKRVAANLSFGYRMQNLITTQSYPTYSYTTGYPIQDGTTDKTEVFFMHYLTLMAGIQF
jgi:hypothetical protein